MSVSTPTTGRPTLFLRNATGLVKAWSGFDAFIYSFMSVSLVSLVVVAFVCIYVTLSMETYARIQKFSFYLGIAGLAVMAVILLFSSGDAMHQAVNREAASLFGYTGPDAYQATIDLATKNGYTP